MSVLIIDDHLVVRHSMAAMLRELPCVRHVTSASDGTLALPVCNEEMPDIVIVDARMEPPGAATVRALKLACPQSVCIGVSVSPQEEVIRPMIDAGCVAVFDKADVGAITRFIEAFCQRGG